MSGCAGRPAALGGVECARVRRSRLARNRNPINVQGTDDPSFASGRDKLVLPPRPGCIINQTLATPRGHLCDLRAAVNRFAGQRSSGDSLWGWASGSLARSTLLAKKPPEEVDQP